MADPDENQPAPADEDEDEEDDLFGNLMKTLGAADDEEDDYPQDLDDIGDAPEEEMMELDIENMDIDFDVDLDIDSSIDDFGSDQ